MIVRNVLKKWSKTTTYVMVGAVLLLIVWFLLARLVPSKEEMMERVSVQMQEMIEQDKESSRKRLTITDNDLGIIRYLSLSTSGAEAKKESYLAFAGSIWEADSGFPKFVGQMVNYTYRMLGCKENVLHGAKLTLLLTTLSMLIGFFLSILLALGKISKNRLLKSVCSFYIFFFRGTPLLIQLFVVYFSLPGIFGFAWRGLFDSGDPEAVYKGAFLAALIAFSLNAAAYCAEIVRAAIESIDKGQHEAAKALGLTYMQTMRIIIIPQSMRRMIPPLCNEFVMMIKDVSLVFAISLMDITTISKTIMTSEGSYIVFIPALVIYLVITAIFTYLFGKVEKRLSIYD